MTEHRMTLDEMKARVNWAELEALVCLGSAFYARNGHDPTEDEHRAMLPIACMLAASGNVWLQ